MPGAPLLLRPVTSGDLPLLTGEDSPYEDFGPRPSRLTPHDPLLTAASGGLAVADRDDGVLGNVSWVWQRWGPNEGSRNPMIGIWLASSARGRGVGAWAQHELARRFFADTTTNRVEAHTAPENGPERGALEAAGFRHEGVVRGAQWRGGRFHDVCLYAVLRGELPQAPLGR